MIGDGGVAALGSVSQFRVRAFCAAIPDLEAWSLCAFLNEAHGLLRNASAYEPVTKADVAMAAAVFADVGKDMVCDDPKLYAKALRSLAIRLNIGANRLDPEGAPS